MDFRFGYLTPKQRKYWGLRRSGLTQADISREMEVTRQTVNKTFNAIDSRVSKALLEAAQINKVEISRVDPKKGFLLGRSPSLGMDVLVTFSDRNGILVWYRGEGGCSKCSWLSSCKQKLLMEAEDRGIPLPEEAEDMEPSKLSETLFKKIMEE
jgi:transcriptional regulator with XRE-family HTH domain